MTTATATETAPAAGLPGLVDVLVAGPVEDLPVELLQEQIAVLAPQVRRLQGYVQLLQAELAAACDGQLPTGDGGRRSVAGWLAEVHRDTAASCASELRTVGRLRRVLPKVVQAVLAGVLTPEQAAVLARLIGRIGEQELADSQDALIQVAAACDPLALSAWVREQIATHCEPDLDATAATSRNRRYLQTRREPDGCLRGRFVLAPEDSEAVLTAIEALARRQGLADERSAGQRRADALVEVCELALRHGELPEHGGQRPQLSYVLPADWAAARHAEAACRDCGPRCPAHRPPGFAEAVAAGLPGHTGVPAQSDCARGAWSGPQTRSRIEALLCDSRISRVLLDSLGQVRGLEALTDSVTPRQRRVMAARDGGCVARGCRRPPAFCDAHHLTRRADGGATTLGNMVLLCRRHHVLWHLGKLQLHQLRVPWHPDAAHPPSDWADQHTHPPGGP